MADSTNRFMYAYQHGRKYIILNRYLLYNINC